MTCEVDIKAYALGEASPAERRAAEAHIAGCTACRAEFESLSTLRAMLAADHDQEPPRRIAFVSDKIFEPKWWQRPLQGMNPFQLLAPAALAALAAFAVVKTQAPAAPSAVAGVNIQQQVNAALDKAVTERVGAAVKQAVAEVQAQDQRDTATLVHATERRMRIEHEQSMAETMAAVDYRFELMRKREVKVLRASTEMGAN